jgi:hypothetical protein
MFPLRNVKIFVISLLTLAASKFEANLETPAENLYILFFLAKS